jgi:Zn-dependent protease
MTGINTLFYIIILIMSVVVHEVAHGFVADRQGDPTARYAGRLTLNPLRHLDFVGSILLPVLLVIFNAGFLIGWAKPVPYNERNLRNKRYGTAIVASAGIFANLTLAVVFGISIRFASILGAGAPAYISIATAITVVNILLALFNLIPIPPLDGSKILFSVAGGRVQKFKSAVEYVSLPLLLLFVFFLWPSIISPVIGFLFRVLTGIVL